MRLNEREHMNTKHSLTGRQGQQLSYLLIVVNALLIIGVAFLLSSCGQQTLKVNNPAAVSGPATIEVVYNGEPTYKFCPSVPANHQRPDQYTIIGGQTYLIDKDNNITLLQSGSIYTTNDGRVCSEVVQ